MRGDACFIIGRPANIKSDFYYSGDKANSGAREGLSPLVGLEWWSRLANGADGCSAGGACTRERSLGDVLTERGIRVCPQRISTAPGGSTAMFLNRSGGCAFSRQSRILPERRFPSPVTWKGTSRL